MASIYFYKSFNMRTPETWAFNEAASDEDTFVLDGTNAGTLAFSAEWFDYAHGEAFGNINFGSYSRGGEEIFGFIPDGTVGANYSQELLQGQGSQAFFEYVLEGDDYLNGQDGRQVIYAYDGDDTVWGGKGNDALYGGKGRDSLGGGLGDDLLRGGAGQDHFVFNEKKAGIDTLDDFSVGQDTIELYGGYTGAPFRNIGSHGTLDDIYFRANAGGNAEDANDRVLYDTVTGALYFDADANGAGAKVQIALIGIVDGGTLSADNFQVVTLA